MTSPPRMRARKNARDPRTPGSLRIEMNGASRTASFHRLRLIEFIDEGRPEAPAPCREGHHRRGRA